MDLYSLGTEEIVGLITHYYYSIYYNGYKFKMKGGFSADLRSSRSQKLDKYWLVMGDKVEDDPEGSIVPPGKSPLVEDCWTVI